MFEKIHHQQTPNKYLTHLFKNVKIPHLCNHLYYLQNQMAITVVEGLLEKDDTKELERVRMSMAMVILEIIDESRERILAADDSFREFLLTSIERLVDTATFEGIGNIPEEGRVIVAPNHPFGMPDISSLMCHLADRQPGRPWKCIGDGSPLKRITPRWEDDPSFTRNFIPIKRERRRNSTRTANRDEIFGTATQFLQEETDPILFIAPEGTDVAYQNRISRPYKGFAEIARATRAPIVPVLFTGEADLDQARFRIHGQVLEPFEAMDDPIQTCNEWVKRLYRKLFENHDQTP